ncbi:hypothetical protein MINTM008_50160 [Mycobacterium intracellulare]|uniref:Uncharacterized protein n=1 Tax=Mycobacterium intracellulare TaxID=1767 RepID=A0A7R7MYV4_MYCIT|nr:hypothetical protein MINTM002_47500 [Mycobacterium intracellulare]BCP39459.1 hypothetical protein MINTMi198_48290 [Mycobacterium intracellulare M.i.198]BCO59590.1 hypothetical protein MINTM005_48340 [Mycobacterium intracellulare]BCO64855.1 hypothetical protein MINTM006_48050 [Mycobacterium intracellulare]BCO70165.1 hypothetical protein MINTM007_47760 [Mycobacterium intracellulare]
MTLGLQPRGLLMYRAADLVQDVLKLRRLHESALLPVMGRRVRWQLMRQLVGGHITNGAITVH